MNRLIDQHGAIGVGQQLALAADGAWVIDQGVFEIYIQCEGRRRFLCELSGAGAVIFGTPTSRLIALAPQGGRLSYCAYPAEGVLGGEPARFAQMLDEWIHCISRGLALAAPVKPDAVPVLPGQTASLAKEDIARAGRGVQWISDASISEVDYLGMLRAPSEMLALTELTWVVAPGACTFNTRSTSALVGEGHWLAALSKFHELAGLAVSALARLSVEAEYRRLEDLEDQTLSDVSAARASLVGIFEPFVAPESSDDLGFAISRVVGRNLPDNPAGPNMVARCAALGLRPRIVALTSNWWREDRGGLIGILEDGRTPVALISDWRGRYWMHQKGRPPQRMTQALAAQLDPQGVTLADQLPNRPLSWRDLFEMVGRLTPLENVTVLAAAALAAALGFVMPLLLEQVVDVFIPDGLVRGLAVLGISMVLLQIGSSMTSLCSELTRIRIDGKSSVGLQTGIMDRVLRLPSRFLKAQSSADLGLRILSIEQARRTLSSVLSSILMSGLYGLSGFALLIYYSRLGGLAAGILFAILIAGALWAGRAQLRAISEGEALTANISSLTLQIIQNMTIIRAFGAERRLFALWARNTAAARARSLRARLVQIRFDTFAIAYDGFAIAVVFAAIGYGTFGLGGEGLSPGAYFAFLTAFQGVLGSSSSVCHGIVALFGMQPVIERAKPILQEAPESSPDAIDPGPLSGDVELSHVTFRYSAAAMPILRDVTIRVERGTMVALVGPSGSGKSTALSLVLGFERPETGIVLFDGRDLSKLDKSAVRRQIGVVRQTSRPVGGSIFENIIGMHTASMDAAWEAAELAGIADDIRALPMGMHTMIMEGVSAFSGGQVQRLLLARALVGRPKLLILDEATSALDNRAQSLVTRNIEQLGITRLVVAHRLSTIEHAHRIYYMRDGAVQESGSFDELLAAKGEFATFARRQII